ncbi:MAG TPA: ABC transporter permease, partial [Gemmatimonadales bacterium]
MRNVMLALRMLAKSPFVTAVAVLSLGLGIGANAAMYSVFDEMLRSPLPAFQPERLANFAVVGPSPGSNSCNQAGDCDAVFSYPMFRDLEKAQTGFSGIAAHRSFGANISYHGQTSSNEATEVSGSYFPVLGLTPALGRLLTPNDDQTIGANYVAVLSYAYWSTRLGSDRAVLNQTILVNGQSMTIVGVAPKGFDGTVLGSRPVLFVPISMRGLMNPGFNGFTQRRTYWAYLFGRLKPGVTMSQAGSTLNGVYHAIINDVEAPLQQGMSDKTMVKFRAKQVVLADGRRGQSSIRGNAEVPLMLMLATTAIVLLIACANIANLLLARGAGRASEIAVRMSLGATRARIVIQLLTESTVLAVMGGLVSLFVAYWTLWVLASMLPIYAAATFHVALRPTVMVFAGVLAIVTGMLFGLAPALQSTRPDLVTAIRNATGKHSGARAASRFRTVLATAQIALSMALLSSAGLFIKSLDNVSKVDLGLKTDDIVTFSISPELSGYDSTRGHVLFDRVEQDLAVIPGVTNVSEALVGVIAGNNWGNSVSVEGFKKGPDTDDGSRFNEVGTGFFRLLNIPVLSGREFTASDVLGSPKVAIVNEAFAKKFNLGHDAVGKHMAMGGDKLDIEIVGLVKDSKYSNVKLPVPPVFFLPSHQYMLGSVNFYVRGVGQVQQILHTVPSVVAKLDPNLPVEDLKTLPQQVQETVFMDRMISQMSAAFAILATLLAALGLYGVLAYSVAQRTREIGVRQALGASARDIRAMVLKQVGLMTAVGGIIGLAGAIAGGRAARSLLFGLESTDPVVVVAATILLAMVAAGAGYIPALRASRVA